MFKQISFSVLGIAFVAVVLLCAGIYFYVEWSNRRFVSELPEPPQAATTVKPVTEAGDSEIGRVEPKPVEFASEDVNENTGVSESESIEVSELTNEDIPIEAVETAESAAEFDPTSLLSAFGFPEEVRTLLDEGTDAEDFQEAETYLIEEYGQSPEVEAILEKLMQMSGGPVEFDEITGLLEAWVQVLPEEDRETRRQLIDALTQLYQAEAAGEGSGEIRIEIRTNPRTVVKEVTRTVVED